MKKPKLVMIEWEDSCQASGQWQWLENLQTPPIIKCISVGFLVKDTKKEKCLAISMANAEQVSGIISIPSSCIKRIKRLTF